MPDKETNETRKENAIKCKEVLKMMKPNLDIKNKTGKVMGKIRQWMNQLLQYDRHQAAPGPC